MKNALDFDWKWLIFGWTSVALRPAVIIHKDGVWCYGDVEASRHIS